MNQVSIDRPVHLDSGDPPPADPRRVILAANEIMILVLAISCVAVAYAFPFRAVKYGLILFFTIFTIAQTMRRPAVGLAMLAFASPALDLIPQDLFPLRGFNAETAFLLFALFVWYRANQLYGKLEIRSKIGKWILIYALLIFISGFRTWLIWQMSLFDVLSKAKNHLTYLALLPVAFHTLRSRRDQKLLLIAVSASLMLNAASAINFSFMAFVGGTLERHRASALLATQPNIFGGAMALYLPLFIALALNRIGSRWFNLWFLLGSGTVAFALILTLSRGAWIGAAGGLLALALVRDRKLLVGILIAAASFQLWVPQQAIERAKSTTQHKGDLVAGEQLADDSTQMRIEQYKSLPNMMLQRPILGSGYKSFPRVFKRYGTLGRAKGAHSTYCQIGTEEGIVGLVVLGLVFWNLIWIGIRGGFTLKDPLLAWISLGLFAGAVSMGLCMATGARFEAQKVFGFYWLLFGIVEYELAKQRANEPATGPLLVPAGKADA